MDFIDELTSPDAPIEREVTFTTVTGEKKSGMVYFRRISGAERQKLLAGLKFTSKRGSGESELEHEIDLSQNEGQQHMLVAFSVVRKDGKRVFASASDVAKLEAQRIKALYDIATEVNREDADLGKP